MAVVFDSSALLAVTFGEEGAEAAKEAMPGGILCAVNASEIVACFVERGAGPERARRWLQAFGMAIRPFDQGLAVSAGLLREQTRGQGLSLGDRACIALAIREGATVITADRTWATLDLGVEVALIR